MIRVRYGGYRNRISKISKTGLISEIMKERPKYLITNLNKLRHYFFLPLFLSFFFLYRPPLHVPYYIPHLFIYLTFKLKLVTTIHQFKYLFIHSHILLSAWGMPFPAYVIRLLAEPGNKLVSKLGSGSDSS